jgi:competence protein ComGC
MKNRCIPALSPRTGGSLYGVAILFVTLFLLFVVFLPQFLKMKDGIYRVSCKEIRKKVELAVANYDANNTKSIVKSGQNIDLDFLKASAFLAEIQRCPQGGKFLFGPQGEIYCSAHPYKVELDGPDQPGKETQKSTHREGEK